MELKKEDFILITALDGKKVYGLRPDYFKEKPVEEVVKEAMEEKKEVEIVIIEPEPKPEPPPEVEDPAEIIKKKEIEELKAKLAALEK